jgi:hypothetical protein
VAQQTPSQGLSSEAFRQKCNVVACLSPQSLRQLFQREKALQPLRVCPADPFRDGGVFMCRIGHRSEHALEGLRDVPVE